MPWTPIRLRASRTSSSLNGLMTAMTIFMIFLPGGIVARLTEPGPGGSDCHARGATKIPVASDGPYGAAYRPAAQKLSGFLAASKAIVTKNGTSRQIRCPNCRLLRPDLG